MGLLRSFVAVVPLLLLACDKPSSHPDSATGGGASGGGAASGGGGSPAEGGAAEGGGAGDDGSTPKPVTRSPVVPKEHEYWARFEGEGFANDCKTDTSCKTGGCSGEVCTAEEGVITTCDVVPVTLPADAACGCVEAQCIWWSPTGKTLPPANDTSPTKPTPNSGEAPRGTTEACGKATCKPGQQCVSYYGIAGPQGPKFESCEWVCEKGQSCPKGTKCVTVADGPGRVCR